MGIRKISLGVAAAALVGAMPAMAAAPVTPSVASISLAPAAGSSLGSTMRQGSIKSRNGSNVASGAVAIGVLALAAGVGGIVAATSGGHSSVSP